MMDTELQQGTSAIQSMDEDADSTATEVMDHVISAALRPCTGFVGIILLSAFALVL